MYISSGTCLDARLHEGRLHVVTQEDSNNRDQRREGHGDLLFFGLSVVAVAHLATHQFDVRERTAANRWLAIDPAYGEYACGIRFIQHDGAANRQCSRVVNTVCNSRRNTVLIKQNREIDRVIHIQNLPTWGCGVLLPHVTKYPWAFALCQLWGSCISCIGRSSSRHHRSCALGSRSTRDRQGRRQSVFQDYCSRPYGLQNSAGLAMYLGCETRGEGARTDPLTTRRKPPAKTLERFRVFVDHLVSAELTAIYDRLMSTSQGSRNVQDPCSVCTPDTARGCGVTHPPNVPTLVDI